jgi:hypothetical protein
MRTHRLGGLAGLGWQSIRETRERACKALLFVGGVQVGLVRPVRFGFRPGLAGGRCFQATCLSVRKLLCGIRVLGAERGWVVSRRFSGLSTFPGSGSGGGAAFLYARHEACEQASEQASCDYGN